MSSISSMFKSHENFREHCDTVKQCSYSQVTDNYLQDEEVSFHICSTKLLTLYKELN